MTITDSAKTVSPQLRRRQAHASLLELAPAIEEAVESSAVGWLKHVSRAAETAQYAGRRSSKASTAVLLALHKNPRPADPSEQILELTCQLGRLERVADAYVGLESGLQRWTDLVAAEATLRGLETGGRSFRYMAVGYAEAEMLAESAELLIGKCNDLWLRAKAIADETAAELGFVASPISTDEQAKNRYLHTLEARMSSDQITRDLKDDIQALTENRQWEIPLLQLRPLSNKLIRAAEAFADLQLAQDILSDAAEVFDPYFASAAGAKVRSDLGLNSDDAVAAAVELIKIDSGSELQLSLT